MAYITPATIADDWPTLRANPVFRRAMMPRGLRWLVRSPLPRALVLTAVALAAYEAVWRFSLSWPLALGAGVVFWFLVHFVQRAFCWMELNTLARTGNLADYLNSGLSRADVAMGVIQPAVIAESVAIAGLLLWFLISDPENTLVLVILGVILFLQIRRLLEPPTIFLPDAESYMRRPGPLALVSVGVMVLVPLVIWFSIYYAIVFPTAIGLAIANIPVDRGVLMLIGFVGAWFVAGWLIGKWHGWRLRRFYKRVGSFDDLFDTFLDQSRQ